MGAGPAPAAERPEYNGGITVSQTLYDSFGPKLNVPDPWAGSVSVRGLFADGVPRLNAFQSAPIVPSYERTYSEAGPVYVDPDTGGEIRPVAASAFEVRALPPASGMVSMGPQRNFLMEGSAAERADKVGYYNALASSDNFWDKAKGVGGRIFTNAAYDVLDGAIGVQSLLTDANARSQLGAKVVYAATHPVNTVYTAAKEVESYVSNTSLGQMAEDGARVGVSTLFGAGAGKVVATAGGLGLDATVATSRWLAPAAGEMVFNSIDRMGLVLRIVPDGPNALGETNYVLFNKTHVGSMPQPKGTGPNGGLLQSHHGLQGRWAEENLAQFGYNRSLAPTMTIETGSGFPHTSISQAQIVRREARVAAGEGKWSSSLQQELRYTVDDLSNAGFHRSTIERVLDQQYRMLNKLNVPYDKIKGW